MAQSQTDDEGTTTISVTDSVADELHDLKDRGDSYNDVVERLLEEHNEREDE